MLSLSNSVFVLDTAVEFMYASVILFSKNVRSCAAQDRMKMTLEKKFDNVCHFLAPVRFQSHLSALLKTFISIEKYHFIEQKPALVRQARTYENDT